MLVEGSKPVMSGILIQMFGIVNSDVMQASNYYFFKENVVD